MRDNYESYNPLISIIIPLYNRKDTIERAIESLVSQSYQNWELIIVDDCSIDESISKVEAYSDSRIRLLKRSSNAGYLSARNAGLSVMRGEWFGFLDSDDALTSDALERVVHTFTCLDDTVNTVRGHKLDSERNMLCNTLYQEGIIPPMTMHEGETWYVIRTNLLGSQRFLEGARWADSELWMRLLPYMKQYFIDEVLYIWHTEGEDRLSTSVSEQHQISKYETYAQIIDVNPSYFFMRRNVGLPDVLPGVTKFFLENNDVARALQSSELFFRAETGVNNRKSVAKSLLLYTEEHPSDAGSVDALLMRFGMRCKLRSGEVVQRNSLSSRCSKLLHLAKALPTTVARKAKTVVGLLSSPVLLVRVIGEKLNRRQS